MENVLDILEENFGKKVSGEKIAEKLNVSRNAVWKNVNSLKKQGFNIQSEKNGYVLLDDVITKNSVEKFTKRKVTVLDETDSTNNYLKRKAETAKDGEIVIARRQTAGKGRLGRSFSSPAGGIYISIFLRPEGDAEQALNITTSCAVAAATAIEYITGRETKIKWVNDIFLDNRKVCGILTEAGTDVETGTLKYAVVGVGIDVYKQELPEEIKNIAGYLFESPCGEINRLAAEFIDRFFYWCKSEFYINEYRKRSYLDNKTIEFTEKGETKQALVLGVDENCGLIINENGTERVLRSGEVRITKYEKE